jgi:hypothetical protein
MAPVGTPFVGADATDAIGDLLSERQLRRTGYFDPAKVKRIADYLRREKQALSLDPGECMRPNRQAVERLIMGMALTFVVSTQVLADQVRRGEFKSPAPHLHGHRTIAA